VARARRFGQYHSRAGQSRAAKTGTSRQAELVSLLAALPMTALGLR